MGETVSLRFVVSHNFETEEKPIESTTTLVSTPETVKPSVSAMPGKCIKCKIAYNICGTCVNDMQKFSMLGYHIYIWELKHWYFCLTIMHLYITDCMG